MDFVSFKFIIFILLAITIFRICPFKYRVKVILPVLNIVFIFSFIKHPIELLPLIFFLLLGFICVKTIENYPTRKNIILSIVLIVSAFVYLKKYTFISVIPSISSPYLIVGISYILFRILHIIIDIYGQAIKHRLSPTIFFNYTCLFLSFASGPIQRIQECKEQEACLKENELTQETVFCSLSRIINGYLKITILSTIFFSIYNKFFMQIAFEHSLFNFFVFYMGASFFYTLYLYYNFSAYMDIIIGIGRFLGFQLPENFNRPFASHSFLEFWSRWHITLSSWFRFYIFNPVVKVLAYRFTNLCFVPYIGVIVFFVTFLLIGIWHGSSPPFVIFGIFLGLGVSINKFYDLEMRKRLGKKSYNKICNNKLYRLLGSGFMYSYFSIALTCLWMDLNGLTNLLAKLGFVGIIGVFILGGIISAGVMASLKIFAYFFDKINQQFAFLHQNFYSQQVFLSLRVFLLILFLILKFATVPEFVYKKF